MIHRFLLASGNPDKLREICRILPNFPLESILERIPDWEVEESGLSIEENALLKARTACGLTGLPSMAEDTGLFAWALGGGPGVYSARYAGTNCTYNDNVRKLLNALKGEEGDGRRAEFRTAAALVAPDGRETVTLGTVKGYITESPSGSRGFGYDPVFLSTELGCTFASASPEMKNRVSHRARAILALVPHLERLLRQR